MKCLWSRQLDHWDEWLQEAFFFCIHIQALETYSFASSEWKLYHPLLYLLDVCSTAHKILILRFITAPLFSFKHGESGGVIKWGRGRVMDNKHIMFIHFQLLLYRSVFQVPVLGALGIRQDCILVHHRVHYAHILWPGGYTVRYGGNLYRNTNLSWSRDSVMLPTALLVLVILKLSDCLTQWLIA